MIEGERQLWCAVIAQAIDDATAPLARGIRRRMEQVRAREWFTDEGKDYQRACALAGYEPDRIRTATMKLIEAVKPSDLEPRVRRGVVANLSERRPDRMSPSTQDSL